MVSVTADLYMYTFLLYIFFPSPLSFFDTLIYILSLFSRFTSLQSSSADETVDDV